MEKNNFGFSGLAENKEISPFNSIQGKQDFVSLKPKSLKSFFGAKSFETSWGFIESLA